MARPPLRTPDSRSEAGWVFLFLLVLPVFRWSRIGKTFLHVVEIHRLVGDCGRGGLRPGCPFSCHASHPSSAVTDITGCMQQLNWKKVGYWWPHALIAISVLGLAYRYRHC